jgi:hypothetical protein
LAIVGAYYDDNINGTDSGSAYIFKRSDDYNNPNWYEQAKLTASDGATGDRFGRPVSISGDYAIVGTIWDDNYTGSAYIFTPNDVDPNNWDEITKLTASDGTAGDKFSYSVSINGDYAIVGAEGDDDNGTGSGSAYIFKWDGTSWSEQQKLLASDGVMYDNFGQSVSISGDLAIVGALLDDNYTGSAYIFKWDGTSWVELQKLAASDGAASDYFGVSVSISGDYIIVGAHADDDNGSDSGSAYVFENICNEAPDANAGDDQTCDTGPDGTADVILDCSDSNDPDGDELTYTWFLDGNEIATGCNPTIELPCGTYIIVLIVNDGITDSEPDYVEITVEDGTPPEITCPGDIILECPADIDPTNTGSATATDNCDDAPVITFSDSVSGSCPGIIERTWTATDASGKSNSCMQVITVADTTQPSITCPADVTLECPADTSVAANGTATGSDSCGGVIITHSDTWAPACGNTGTLTRIWTATDECGNSAICVQTITVVDTSNPVIIGLDADYLLAAVGQTVNFSANVSDNCDDTVAMVWNFGDGVISSEPSHAYELPGIYTVTITATDDCGNWATDSMIVVVYDPAAGFTTGGGWFVPDSESFINGVGITDAVSKANFGFIVKYKKGADNPDGNLEFQYRAGDIDLKSSDMEWLVVQSTTKVRFKGLATINGAGEYTFKVTAEDNGEPGTGDWFKIEIWIGPDVDTENSPPTPKHKAQGYLGGGNIQIHQK